MSAIAMPAAVRDIVLNTAAASPLTEICGLLLGQDEAVVEAHVSPNRHPEPNEGFAICDALYAQLQRSARKRGMRVIGCFHSHPRGDASPSQTDLLAVQEDGFVWVICTPKGQLQAWRARNNGKVKWFQELLVLTEQAAPHCAAASGPLMSHSPQAPIV